MGDCNRIQRIGKRLMGWSVIGYMLMLMGCQATLPQGQQVSVTQVISGQTLEVLDRAGQNPRAERVRLLGIDAPTGSQEPWSTRATERLIELIGDDRTVLLESDIQPTRDSNGSQLRLAYLWREDRLLNEVLVEEGYALARSSAPNTKYEQRLTHAQEKARLTGAGIWNPTHPMTQTPQEFRRSSQE
ncbi:thermonuclease family protein [Egbenema bharatensis]|uniref:thermonuclease family protein n=1 Tax=Egbenema bharatensis TaxID=3463334 RepID=UPI003A8B5557